MKQKPHAIHEFKNNYDVDVFEDANKASIGVTVRNDKGEVLAAVFEKISMPLFVVMVEILVAKRAVQFTIEIDITHSIFEGNSAIVYKVITQDTSPLSVIGHLIKGTKSITGLVVNNSLSHTRRWSNIVAFALVRRTRPFFSFVSLDVVCSSRCFKFPYF